MFSAEALKAKVKTNRYPNIWRQKNIDFAEAHGFDFKKELPLFNELQEKWLGKAVSKMFKGGDWHDGIVVQVIPPEQDEIDRDVFFKVLYDDGDGEDVLLKTMHQLWMQRRSPTP